MSDRIDGLALVTSLILAILTMSETASAHNCVVPFLSDNADVQNNPVAFDYDVHFTSDSGTWGLHATSFMRAGWVRDGLVVSHELLAAPPYSFLLPSFSGAFPMDTCIFTFDIGAAANAPADQIQVESQNLTGERSTRGTMAHEVFHHVQYASIPYSSWPGWGTWVIEGIAATIPEKLWWDVDMASARYLTNVNDFLGLPNKKLFERDYDTALWWNYMAEQFGTELGEPERGVDFLRTYWNLANGSLPDSIGILVDTIDVYGGERNVEELFLDFSIANYTHTFDLSLPVAVRDRYRYVDESFPGGGTAYDTVALTTVTAANTTQSSDVVAWGSRYFEVSTDPAGSCEAIGFWGDAAPGTSLNWAVVGVKNGTPLERVTEIHRGGGNIFYRALINPPSDGYTRLALVVAGHNQSAPFDYAYGTGPVSGTVLYPILARPVRVGAIDNEPQRFRVRLLVQGPASLTPAGQGPVSLKGLDPTLFGFSLRSVSTGAVYLPDVHNGDYVDGEYWVYMTAPRITNAADGDLYTLEVCLCPDADGSCSSIVASIASVKYEDEVLHEMLVIDKSGSMDYPTPLENSKMESAKNAGRNYSDGTQNDDSLGVVSFHGVGFECNIDADLDFSLSPVPGNRHLVAGAISSLSAFGGTSIGDGIIMARDHLLATAGPADTLGIVLMSDGMENEEIYWDQSNIACIAPAVKDSFDASIPGFASHIRIDTMAFGSDADQGALQQMARFTDGGLAIPVHSDAPTQSAGGSGPSAVGAMGMSTMNANVIASPGPEQLEVPNRLADAYRTIAEHTRGQDRLFFGAVALASGIPETIDIPVEEMEGGGLDDATFAINWNLAAANVTVELRDPNNNLITGATPDWGVDNMSTNTFYRYADTLPIGIWQLTLTSDASVQATLGLAGKIVRGVELDTNLSQLRQEGPLPECTAENYHYLRGLPVVVKANITDSIGGIDGVDVEARILNARGTTNRLNLFDDGLHEDGLADDGIYANTYTRTPYWSRAGVPDFPFGPPTGQWGSYSVIVTAEGTSNYSETFRRYERRGFHVHEFDEALGCDPDLDGDGLPDRWEDLYGLDSGDPGDALLDHDNDGLSALQEFDHGTLPFAPDTDFGGESDGSEVLAGRDPLYDEDDLVPPILVYGVVTHVYHFDQHLPRPQTNILHFPIAASYQEMEIWRKDPAESSFHLETVVDLTLETTGVYYDTSLSNEATYEYFLVARALSGAKTAPTAAFSGTPHGNTPPGVQLLLNNGYPVSDSATLLVELSPNSASAVEMIHSQQSSMSGALWMPLATSFSVTVTTAGPAPYNASYFGKVRDVAALESLVAGDSILIDENGDNDGDGDSNSGDSDDDNDGISDFDEINTYGTDAMSADTDGDGLSDREEIFLYGTDPLEIDSDNDSFSDSVELAAGSDPLDPLSQPAVPVPVLGGPFGWFALVIALFAATAWMAGRGRSGLRRKSAAQR
jgi:hypothetical protein